jgi:hypothetical protein
VNPKVLLAEAIALQCAQNSNYISSPEFKRRVLGFSESDDRNVHAHFTKLMKRLSAEEQQRMGGAQSEATGARFLAPETVAQRLQVLTRQPNVLIRRLPANAFYKMLFPGVENVRAPASLRDLYAAVRRRLPEGTRADVDQMRSAVTGLEPEKGGNVAVDVSAVLHRAEVLARQVAEQAYAPLTTLEFQRRSLGIDDTVPDAAVKQRFSVLILGVSSSEQQRLVVAQSHAVGAPKKAATRSYDLNAMVERAKSVARDVSTEGQPVSLLKFYQRALGYDTASLETLKVRASQYAGRLSPDQKKKFEEAKAVAIGKKQMTAAAAGQVFAPNADDMDAMAELARQLGSETFVPTSWLPEILFTPLQSVDPKTFQIPGLLADVVDIAKPLGFPAGTIDWKEFAVPPSEGRLHVPVNTSDSDDGAIDLPEDLPPPASLPSTPLPRVVLTPATVGILVAAGALAALDGPLPFGDWAAASLVGGRLAIQ